MKHIFRFTSLSIVLIITSLVQFSRGNLNPRVHFESETGNVPSPDSAKSTWAVNVPVLTVRHTVPAVDTYPTTLRYLLRRKDLSLSIICRYELYVDKCTISGSQCLNCTDLSSSDRSVIADFTVSNLDSTKNGSVILYDYPPESVSQKPIHKFTVSYCAEYVNNTKTVNQSSNACGYNCTSRYECLPGYESTVDTSSTFTCGASAKWMPDLPACTAVPETTSVDATTTSHGLSPDPTGTAQLPPGSTEPDPISTAQPPGSTEPATDPFPNAGLIMAVIGGLLLAAGVGVIVYVMLKEVEIQNKRMLNGMFVLCVIAGAVGIGLVFGNPSNQSAVIGGIVVGSLALAGMFVIIGFQIKQIISPNTKAIQGKPEPNPEL